MKKKYESIGLALKGGLIVLALIKSIFSAITQVAWGAIGLFGFMALLSYLAKGQKIDLTSINTLFLKGIIFITQHLTLFFWVFFGLYLYFEVKEVLKK